MRSTLDPVIHQLHDKARRAIEVGLDKFREAADSRGRLLRGPRLRLQRLSCNIACCRTWGFPLSSRVMRAPSSPPRLDLPLYRVSFYRLIYKDFFPSR